jgi:hypothetical protein
LAKQKPPTPPRVNVGAARFHEHLADQIGYLQASCDAFDAGSYPEFKRIAAAVRTLVHDTGSSTSLLQHLGEKAIPFASTAYQLDERNLLSHHGLIGFRMGPDGSRYVGHGAANGVHETSFDDWWNEVVIKDGAGRKITRRQLILVAANQDGGTHVDADIDEAYEALARSNSLGWVAFDGISESPMAQAEGVSIRQIGWEVLETLRRREARLLANEKCACGSGRKNRYCCGKGASSA